MNDSRDILQDTSRYQEILNTVVGSKVYYMFQEEVYKALKDPNDLQLGNKIALDETLQYLWCEYMGNSEERESYLKREFLISDLWNNVDHKFNLSVLKSPRFIEADTFEEFLEELKEMKLEKSS